MIRAAAKTRLATNSQARPPPKDSGLPAHGSFLPPQTGRKMAAPAPDLPHWLPRRDAAERQQPLTGGRQSGILPAVQAPASDALGSIATPRFHRAARRRGDVDGLRGG